MARGHGPAARGYAVALQYRTSQAEAQQAVVDFRAAGIEAEAYAADLTNEQDVQRLVEQTLARFGRIDVLVNAAATWSPKPLEDVTAADVRGFLEANTLSTFLTSQQVGLAMVRQPEGGRSSTSAIGPSCALT